MAFGSNLGGATSLGPSSAIMRLVNKALGIKANGRGSLKLRKKIFCYAGEPTTNTANESPAHGGITGREVGSICYDSTNNDVYVVSAYTNDTGYTWTKVAT